MHPTSHDLCRGIADRVWFHLRTWGDRRPPSTSPLSQPESLVVQTKERQALSREKRFTVDQIVGKFREAEVALPRGKTVPEAVRKLA